MAPSVTLAFKVSRGAEAVEGGVVFLFRPAASFGPTRRLAPSEGEDMSSPCREQAVTNAVAGSLVS